MKPCSTRPLSLKPFSQSKLPETCHNTQILTGTFCNAKKMVDPYLCRTRRTDLSQNMILLFFF